MPVYLSAALRRAEHAALPPGPEPERPPQQFVLAGLNPASQHTTVPPRWLSSPPKPATDWPADSRSIAVQSEFLLTLPIPENRCWQESLTGRQGQVRPSLILECPAPAVPQREHVRSRNSSSLFCSQGSNDLNNPNQNTNQQVNDEVVSRQSLSIPTETIQNPNQRTAVLLKHCSGYPESDRTNARQATSESRPHQFPERGP